MESFVYTITDEVGLHARPAGLLVKEVKSMTSAVTLSAKGKSADAKKIIAVLSLGVKKGEEVEVSVEGENEAADCEALKAFFAANI